MSSSAPPVKHRRHFHVSLADPADVLAPGTERSRQRWMKRLLKREVLVRRPSLPAHISMCARGSLRTSRYLACNVQAKQNSSSICQAARRKDALPRAPQKRGAQRRAKAFKQLENRVLSIWGSTKSHLEEGMVDANGNIATCYSLLLM